MKKVKLGVIGCGHRGTWLIKMIDTIEEYEITSICDINLEFAEKAAEECSNNHPGITTEYKEVFASGIDAFSRYSRPYSLSGYDEARIYGIHISVDRVFRHSRYYRNDIVLIADLCLGYFGSDFPKR